MLTLYNNITKDYIEDGVSPVDIMSTYLSIDKDTVLSCINEKTMIKSPFREDDDNASCGFAYNNRGKLKIRDFGGYFFGDCYDVAAYVISSEINKPVDINNKADFVFVLRHIEATFADVFLGRDVDRNSLINLKRAINGIARHRTIIDFTTRPFDNVDKDVWRSFGVNLNYLSINFVYAVENYWLNKHANPYPKYTYDRKDPCYAYFIGVNSKKESLIQLYFPLRPKSAVKFITNNQSMNGLVTLTSNYDMILICKSTKDRLSLQCHIDKLQASPNVPFLTGGVKVGYVNLPSEAHNLNDSEYDFLKSRLKPNGILVSFMDFDTTGRRAARHMKQNYDIDYIFITNGELGLANYGAKDFAELQARHHANLINAWIEKLAGYLFRHLESEV